MGDNLSMCASADDFGTKISEALYPGSNYLKDPKFAQNHYISNGFQGNQHF